MNVIFQKRIERLLLVPTPKQKTIGWYRRRYNQLNSSEIAACLDVSHYRSKLDVLKEKTRPFSTKARKDNDFTLFGNKYEPIARSIYEDLELVAVAEVGSLRHRRYPWLGASPDGLIAQTGKILEIKCPKRRKISHEVYDYRVQMQIQMEVCNINKCDYFQCQFHEYKSKQEYISDKTTKRKGYSVDETTGEEFYWRLDDYSLETVARDYKWFSKILPKLKKFWKDILYYRIAGLDELKDKLEREKEAAQLARSPPIQPQDHCDCDDDIVIIEMDEIKGTNTNTDVNTDKDKSSKLKPSCTTCIPSPLRLPSPAISTKTANHGEIIDWDSWVAATQIQSYLLNDACLDYLKMAEWQENKLHTEPETGVAVEEPNTISIGSVESQMKKWIDYKISGDFQPSPEWDIIKSGDASSTFLEFICHKGFHFEEEVLTHLRGKLPEDWIHTVCYYPAQVRSKEKYEETIKLMKKGVPILYHAALRCNKMQTYGIPDLLVRSDVLNHLVKTPALTQQETTIEAPLLNIDQKKGDGYHYVVVDIKYSTMHLACDGIHILNQGYMIPSKGQMFVYNTALGEMQGFVPDRAYILAKKWMYKKNGKTHKGFSCFDRLGHINFNGRDQHYAQRVMDAINWNVNLRQNFDQFTLVPANCPELYPNMCNRYDSPWGKLKSKIAAENKEITMVWHCGVKHRNLALLQGVSKWDDPRCTAELMGITGKWVAPRIDAILQVNRQNVRKVICHNPLKNGIGGDIEHSALSYNKEWRHKDRLEMFIDYETVNMSKMASVQTGKPSLECSDRQLVAMIGCGWEDPLTGEWQFKGFTVNQLTEKEEAVIFSKFHNLIYTLKKKYSMAHPPRLFHWGHIERTITRKVVTRHSTQRWVFRNFVDFCKVMQNEIIVVHGAMNFGLKEISRAMYNSGLIATNYNSSSCTNGLDAMISMIKCDEYARARNVPFAEMAEMKDIELYNEIDCKVMWEIINYLRQKI